MSHMLYKYPGPHQFQDGGYDYVITEDPEGAVDAGWFYTPAEARAHATSAAAVVVPAAPVPADPNAEPTDAELQQKAAELGIEVDKRWGRRKLIEKIAEAASARVSATSAPDNF